MIASSLLQGRGWLVSVESAVVSFRTPDQVVEGEPWESTGSATLAAVTPRRTFRWYNGQKHFSGRRADLDSVPIGEAAEPDLPRNHGLQQKRLSHMR
ncbi:hypothetical protein ABR737_11890 [Streptomyces sp. Edi2]|uniref:hypothetical protein n=1 Tax=Streptomyces sp. Edi2 TaxID=3162528 RepID=UPI00330646D9